MKRVALFALGLPLLTACQDAPEAVIAEDTETGDGGKPYVPDGRFDAYAVNCEPCENYRL